MTRNTHDRAADHFGTDTDLDSLLSAVLPAPVSTAAGQTVRQALLDIISHIGSGTSGGGGMGVMGEDGEEGAPGPPGPPGPAGSAGSIGPGGPPGVVLPIEPDEPDAPMMIPGQPGAVGAAGATGPAGPMALIYGEDGDEGEPGPPGPIGATGATGGGGNYVMLADSLLGSDTASFDFTSIPGSYKHLQIVLQGRSTKAAAQNDFATLTLNNDSTSGHYDSFWMQVYNGFLTTSGSEDVGAASMAHLILTPAASSATGDTCTAEIWIPDYASATFNKSLHADGYTPMAESTGNLRRWFSGGNWHSTAAITRVTIAPAGGNWKTGSRATLYGLS